MAEEDPRKLIKQGHEINIEHRVVYEIIPAEDNEFEGTVKVHRLRTHYKGVVPVFFFINP